MRKTIVLLVSLLLVVLCYRPSLAEEIDYVGEWVCVAIDAGNGAKQTEYEGTSVADLMKMRFDPDGTLLMTSFGESMSGTWKETAGGISADIAGKTIEFVHKDFQLVNDSSGVLSYFEKREAQPNSGDLLSLAKSNRYVGKWIAVSVDEGNGELKTEIDGIAVSDMLAIQINKDGTLVMTTMGLDSFGEWHVFDGGIRVTADDVSTNMLYQENQLIAKSDNTTIYFGRSEQISGAEATPTPRSNETSLFVGTWNAVRYETTGYAFDADILFPDGCTITLLEDGTGNAFITKGYSEKLIWSEQDGGIAISGSYVFTDPVWNAQNKELTVFYGSSAVSVIFQKSSEAIPEPVTEPTLEPVVAEQIPQNNESVGSRETQLCETTLFTVLFPSEGWVGNEGWLYDREDYCAVKYELKDQNDAVAASVSLSASSEGVDAYRDKIKLLQEHAQELGKESLDEVEICGVTFMGIGYESWGWKYIEYAARVPESSITLFIAVEQPENITDLKSILDSISFSLPVLTPPNVDPPLPEDGTPYRPGPGTVRVGETELTATWLMPDKPIVLDSIFDNQIALESGTLYVLVGKALHAYTMEDGKLVPNQIFENGVMRLEDEFEYLSIGKDGLLYVSQGMYNILALEEGSVIQDNSISGDLVMHPSGEWGISFWATADPKKISASNGELTEEPWVLSDLSDAEKRKGRFSAIGCVAIFDERIYVAGNDVLNGDAQRIAVFDLAGEELFTFGATDSVADDGFGSVTGIAETANGILVQDGSYRDFKLFSKEGEFLGSVKSDELLGTDYPWLSSMIPTDGGVLVAAAQTREDESCEELLIFLIAGF